MSTTKSHSVSTGIAPSPSPPGLPETNASNQQRLQTHAKRVFDIVAAFTLLLLLSPLLCVIGLLVMRDGGPCVYRHARIGMNGKMFPCLKFRSMVPDADAALQRHLATDPEARAEWERDFKLRHDIRITRLGRFIRRTSLDELPQLWNVLRGDMSLVGPRPLRPFEVDALGDWQLRRQEVRPGITGLWQVLGRSDINWTERMQLDYTYARHWSIAADMGILFRTVGAVFHRKGSV